jgi:hypothetical protein
MKGSQKSDDIPIKVDVDELIRRKEELKSQFFSTEVIIAFNYASNKKECHWDFVIKEAVRMKYES